jgi:hypothetical protein
LPDTDGRGPGAGRLPPRVRLQTRFLLHFTSLVVAVIYEPFFTHGKPRGIGPGMSITREIVEEHGGQIRLESEVGRGTTFTVSLPAS